MIARAIIAAALLLALAPAAQAALPGRNGTLAVSVNIDRGDCGEVIDCVDERIRFVHPQSGQARTLPTCADRDCDDSNPAWFPDGSRLAFVRSIGGVGDVFSVRPDGSQLERMGGGGRDQSWAPGGARLAYAQRAPLVSRREIWISDVSGETRSRLTRGNDATPAWSARNRIAFVRREGRFDDIYVIRPDGSGLRRLTRGLDERPNWSPDGRSLVFSRRYAGSDDLAIVAATGGRVRRLTRSGGTMPVWSPDGKKIAFVRGRKLMIMSVRTRAVRTVLTLRRFRSFGGVDWQPRS